MEDEIDLIINILKNNENTRNDSNGKSVTISQNPNQIILKKMPNLANVKYHSRHEIDGGILNKDTIMTKRENIPEVENNSKLIPLKKESKFIKKFFNK